MPGSTIPNEGGLLVGLMRPLVSQMVQESDRRFAVTLVLMPDQTLTVGKIIRVCFI
jgi:hypothetical protein